MVRASLVLACGILPLVLAGTVNKDAVLAKDVASPVELAEREKRLQKGTVLRLYHQTNHQACRAILNSRFYAGKTGIAGGGIYFAMSAQATALKAEKSGCMIECWVAIGKRKNLTYDADRHITAQKMIRAGYDSTWLPRGCAHGPCMPPPAPEIVVYFSDQIMEMSAYSCLKNGKPLGQNIGKPLSDTPPVFHRSEGNEAGDFLGMDYSSIGSISVAQDQCPPCPQADGLASQCVGVESKSSTFYVSLAFLLGVSIGAGVLGMCLLTMPRRKRKIRASQDESASDDETKSPLVKA